MTDAELTAKIGEAGGKVFVGFKDSGAAAGVDELGRVLASASSVAAAKAQVRGLGIQITFEFIDMPTVVARMPAELLALLRQNPLVEYVEPIFPGVRHAQTTTWNVQRVRAPEAWSSSTGSGAKLLIIDSGIENTHPDLSPAVVQTCMPFPDDGLDQYGHGTAVAGIAAAVSNDIQIVGVAHGVSLWTSKDGNAEPTPDFTACGVQFGRTNGVHAINISTGYPNAHTGLTDQINAAYHQNGIVIVVSAGNTFGGPVTYPATLSAAIAISATDTNNNFASFSAVGSKVELTAPGTTVTDVRALTSTCLGGISCATVAGLPLQGTSFSAPHVAAAAAILKAFNPTWTNVEIRDRLQKTAIDLGAAGRDNAFGFGLIDIRAALDFVPPPPPLSVQIDGPTVIPSSDQYVWTADVSGGVGGYTYEWYRQIDYWWPHGSATCHYQTDWELVGTAQSYSSFVSVSEYDFRLRVVVQSGADSDSHSIMVYGDGSWECPF